MFEYVRSGKKEPMLYYLFMASDGTISYKEEKLFDVICKDLDIDEEEKQEIITECEEALREESVAFNHIKTLIPSKKANSSYGISSMYPLRFFDSFNKDRIIWNLINLGYADSLYSKSEKEICDYLVNEWEYSPELYREFIDIADTMNTLEEYRKWLLSALPESAERDNKERAIDIDIKSLQKDVQITIKEATM